MHLPAFDPMPYRNRRLALLARMQHGVAILPTAPEAVRNRDSHYPYRPDSDFWYLSGFPEPEAVIVLVATPHKQEQLLFCREKNLEREIWEGFRFGPQAAAETFGFDAAFPIEELDARLPALLENQPTVFHALGARAEWDSRLTRWLDAVRGQVRAGKSAPGRIEDWRQIIESMRLCKDDFELAQMQIAADIASAAHARAMQVCRPGLFEYQIEAEFLHAFRHAGASGPSYNTIVAGGGNACCLHYNSNNQPLRDGDLLLIDAGCEYNSYASDITRTFPVNGRFSGAQKDCYEIVLAAQLAAIERCRPGQRFTDPHDAAVRVLAQGLLDLKALEGSVDSVIESESYKRFYMHRTGHWLGLDVHDAGPYRLPGADGVAGEWLPLQPSMALTVEPGLYFLPGDDVPAHLHHIGIRIEDDVVITTDAPRVLTAPPKTVADIEALMRS